MNEEFEGIDTKERWLRFACLLGGIFTVYAVDMVSPHDHDHSHSHSH